MSQVKQFKLWLQESAKWVSTRVQDYVDRDQPLSYEDVEWWYPAAPFFFEKTNTVVMPEKGDDKFIIFQVERVGPDTRFTVDAMLVDPLLNYYDVEEWREVKLHDDKYELVGDEDDMYEDVVMRVRYDSQVSEESGCHWRAWMEAFSAHAPRVLERDVTSMRKLFSFMFMGLNTRIVSSSDTEDVPIHPHEPFVWEDMYQLVQIRDEGYQEVLQAASEFRRKDMDLRKTLEDAYSISKKYGWG